jgi:hypothetical protein
MANIEPSDSSSRRRKNSTRAGIIVFAVVLLMTFGVLALLVLWTFRVERPAQAEDATQTVQALYELDGWQPLLMDDFADNDAGWEETSQVGDPGWNVAVQDGSYVWEINSSTNYVLRLGPESVGRTDDFVLSVDVDQVSGPLMSFGLIFRGNDQRYYQFEITEGGYYVIFVAFSETRRGPISSGPTRLIDQNGPNRLTVRAEDDTFTFYINDEFLTEERHGTFRDGRIGVSVSTGTNGDTSRVVFDNLTLYVP